MHLFLERSINSPYQMLRQLEGTLLGRTVRQQELGYQPGRADRLQTLEKGERVSRLREVVDGPPEEVERVLQLVLHYNSPKEVSCLPKPQKVLVIVRLLDVNGSPTLHELEVVAEVDQRVVELESVPLSARQDGVDADDLDERELAKQILAFEQSQHCLQFGGPQLLGTVLLHLRVQLLHDLQLLLLLHRQHHCQHCLARHHLMSLDGLGLQKNEVQSFLEADYLRTQTLEQGLSQENVSVEDSIALFVVLADETPAEQVDGQSVFPQAPLPELLEVLDLKEPRAQFLHCPVEEQQQVSPIALVVQHLFDMQSEPTYDVMTERRQCCRVLHQGILSEIVQIQRPNDGADLGLVHVDELGSGNSGDELLHYLDEPRLGSLQKGGLVFNVLDDGKLLATALACFGEVTLKFSSKMKELLPYDGEPPLAALNVLAVHELLLLQSLLLVQKLSVLFRFLLKLGLKPLNGLLERVDILAESLVDFDELDKLDLLELYVLSGTHKLAVKALN